MYSIAFWAAFSSPNPTGEFCTFSKKSAAVKSDVSSTSPILLTWLKNSIPNGFKTCLTSAPTATLAAVSRALALSSTFLKSLWLYFIPPVRSACPGLGHSTDFSLFAVSVPIILSQFAQSLFSILIAIGLPRVTPPLTPERISAVSFSIFILPPLP